MKQVLTEREQDIAELVSHGLSNRGIAARLKITPGTVKMHLHNIFSKLGLPNRTALALWFVASAAGEVGDQAISPAVR